MRLTDKLNSVPITLPTKIVTFNNGEYALRIRKLTASDLLKLRSMPMPIQSSVVDTVEKLMGEQQPLSQETTAQDTIVENFSDLVVCLGIVAECEATLTEAAKARVAEEPDTETALTDYEYKEYPVRFTPHETETEVLDGDSRVIYLYRLRDNAQAIYLWAITEILTFSGFDSEVQSSLKK